MKKLVCVLIAALLALTLCATLAFAATGDPNLYFTYINGQNNVTLTKAYDGIYGVAFEYKGDSAGYNDGVDWMTVELKADDSYDVFPFDRSCLNSYSYTLQNNGSGTFSLSFNGYLQLKTSVAKTGTYFLDFAVTSYKNSTTGEVVIPADLTIRVPFSVDNVPDTGSSAGGSGVSAPKVMITTSSTNPAQVVAGETFTLNVTFENKGGEAVNGLKAQLSGGETFSVVNGSSTLYISSIAAGSKQSTSIKLKANVSATPGSYPVSFALEYNAASLPSQKDVITGTETISVPVIQIPKVQLTKMQISPSDIYVGQDINVMSSVNNTGKATLYNVNVRIYDESGLFGEQQLYLGNIQPGASGSVDSYISPLAEGSGTLIIEVTYEDEGGKSYTAKDTADVYVSVNTPSVDPGIIEPDVPAETKKPWWPWALGAAVVVGGIGALAVVKKRKKHLQELSDQQEAFDLDNDSQTEGKSR